VINVVSLASTTMILQMQTNTTIYLFAPNATLVLTRALPVQQIVTFAVRVSIRQKLEEQPIVITVALLASISVTLRMEINMTMKQIAKYVVLGIITNKLAKDYVKSVLLDDS